MMNLKGLQKGVARAPQVLRQKLNMGEITTDVTYQDLESRLRSIERELDVLYNESRIYRTLVTNMLNKQIEFSRRCAEMFAFEADEPSSGGQLQVADPAAVGGCSQACIDCQLAVAELLSDLNPDLDSIETRITIPIQRSLEIIRVVRKTSEKRNHKQLDYDRRRAILRRLQEKTERSLRDEKALYKAENDVDQAGQDFNYFNDLLKRDLPILFSLERDFVTPIFQTFYFIQMGVFYRMYAALEKINVGSMDLKSDIQAAFLLQRKCVRENVESLMILHSRNPEVLAGESRYQRVHPLRSESSGSGTAGPSHKGKESLFKGMFGLCSNLREEPPPYSTPSPGEHSAHVADTLTRYKKNKPQLSSIESQDEVSSGSCVASPPPKPPRPTRHKGQPEHGIVVFRFEAEIEGDLSLTVGDEIEIVKRSGSENEWWTGRLNGKEGQFPGNYIRLKHKK